MSTLSVLPGHAFELFHTDSQHNTSYDRKSSYRELTPKLVRRAQVRRIAQSLASRCGFSTSGRLNLVGKIRPDFVRQ
jgi:hypothetical protein